MLAMLEEMTGRRSIGGHLRPSGRRARLPARMPPGDTARLYHRLTSYAPEREWMTAIDDPRVMQGFVQNDMATVPEPCKAYPAGLPAVELPREWPEVSA